MGVERVFACLQPGKVERHSASFWREADMLGSLNHPNVLRFYGAVVVGRDDPSVIGIMTEFMRGGSLAQFLRCACSWSGPALVLVCKVLGRTHSGKSASMLWQASWACCRHDDLQTRVRFVVSSRC